MPCGARYRRSPKRASPLRPQRPARRRPCSGFDPSAVVSSAFRIFLVVVPLSSAFSGATGVPFCVLELQALAAAHPEIERLGATLIALSPQARNRSFSQGSESEPPFPILQDPACEIAVRYRIAFTVAQQFRAAYLALGYLNSTKTGSKSWVLPIPATHVLDRTGLIVLSYLDADYTTRLEPTEIIVALTHLRAASIPGRNNR